MKNNIITHSRLRDLLNYDPVSGVWEWRVRKAHCIHVGDIAGSISKSTGYREIMIDGKTYLAHRLAWFYITGKWPEFDTDHRNMDRADNRLCNLREATRSQNQMNTTVRSGTVSGIKGVVWAKRRGKWKAQITQLGRTTYLGYFDTPQEANVAYMVAAKKFFGEFSRTS